jgi:hypothetical protein
MIGHDLTQLQIAVKPGARLVPLRNTRFRYLLFDAPCIVKYLLRRQILRKPEKLSSNKASVLTAHLCRGVWVPDDHLIDIASGPTVSIQFRRLPDNATRQDLLVVIEAFSRTRTANLLVHVL